MACSAAIRYIRSCWCKKEKAATNDRYLQLVKGTVCVDNGHVVGIK